MLVRMQYQITLGEVERAIVPLVSQGNLSDPTTARIIVRDARQTAIRHGNANNNLLIAEALSHAGVSHISIPSAHLSGPQELASAVHPDLFEAVSKSEGSGLVEYVRSVGEAVDVHTPDALYGERLAIFYGFIHRLSLPVSVNFGKPTGEVRVKDKVVNDVLIPHDPDLDVKGWTVSPYAQALGAFMVQSNSVGLFR